MSSKPPAFRFYAADFYMDTLTWSNEEIGVYLRLLIHQWINKTLPKNEKSLSKISKISPKKFQNVFPNISHKFEVKNENEIYNPRLEEEREKQNKWLKQQAEHGRLGANARWNK